MEPEELAKLYAGKVAAKTEHTAETRAQNEVANAARKDQSQLARTALREVAAAYLNELAGQIRKLKGRMVVQQATDVQTSETAGVRFQIGHGPQYDLSDIGGRISVVKTKAGTQVRAENLASLTPEELTRDFVGQLAKQAIDESGG
jgi:hypothetical protein